MILDSVVKTGGREESLAADEIERLNLEIRNERDVRAEAERGCVSMAKEIERLVEENRKLKGSLDYAWRRIEAETGAVE